ncbi:MAG TPA: HAMP domain-containing sensor histidine kinase [Candidatus Binataceae bacterium]
MFGRSKRTQEKFKKLQVSFSRNLNHHIRNPLNAIVLHADLLTHLVPPGEEIHASLNAIALSSGQLERNLRAILDLYRIETSTFDVKPAAIRLSELIKRQLSEVRSRAERKSIKLTLDSSDPEITVSADRYCLAHALDNLLDNAIKHTEHCQVTVRVYVEPAGAVCIDVEDTGSGIDPARLPLLFESFFHTEDGLAEGQGSGLGLTLAKRYLALNGAELSVKSENHCGSIFTVRLPARDQKNRIVGR